MITKEEWLEAVDSYEPFDVYIEGYYEEKVSRDNAWLAINGRGKEVIVAACYFEGQAEEFPLEKCSIVKRSKGRIPSERIDEKTFWENIERISEAVHGKKEA